MKNFMPTPMEREEGGEEDTTIKKELFHNHKEDETPTDLEGYLHSKRSSYCRLCKR